MYLYIKLRSVTLFSKFSKFVTWKFLKFKDIFNSESFKKVWNPNIQWVRGPRKKGSYGNVRQWMNQLFLKLVSEIAEGRDVHAEKGSYIDVQR